MISIDQDGNVSVLNEIIEQDENEEIKDENIIQIDFWQWIILVFGVIFMIIIIRSSLTNVQY